MWEIATNHIAIKVIDYTVIIQKYIEERKI